MIESPSIAGLNQFVHRQTGIHHVHWVTPALAVKVIEMLKGSLRGASDPPV